MTAITQKYIDTLIETIKHAEDPASVTNLMVATVFEFLNSHMAELGENIEGSTEDLVKMIVDLRRECLGQDVSDKIDNLKEVLSFLEGFKDSERLFSKLTDVSTGVKSLRTDFERFVDIDYDGLSQQAELTKLRSMRNEAAVAENKAAIQAVGAEASERLDALERDMGTLGGAVVENKEIADGEFDRLAGRVDAVGVVPFDGFAGAGYADDDCVLYDVETQRFVRGQSANLPEYNVTMHGLSMPRTDRLFRCGAELYRYYEGRGLEKTTAELSSAISDNTAQINALWGGHAANTERLAAHDTVLAGHTSSLTKLEVGSEMMRWSLESYPFVALTGVLPTTEALDAATEIGYYAVGSKLYSVVDSAYGNPKAYWIEAPTPSTIGGGTIGYLDAIYLMNGKLWRFDTACGRLLELGTFDTSDDLNLSNSRLSLTDMAKKRLFIDMWNNICGDDGCYNPTTGYFELNGITNLTYNDALTIMQNSPQICRLASNALPGYTFAMSPIRTTFPLRANGNGLGQANFNSTFKYCRYLEVVRIYGGVYVSLNSTFYANNQAGWPSSLREITVTCNTSLSVSGGEFPSSLVTLKLQCLNSGLSIPDCNKISLESMQYIVRYSTTTAKTITVHANVYAKLTGDMTNAAAAALSEAEADAWQQIVVDASAKNITFARA